MPRPEQTSSLLGSGSVWTQVVAVAGRLLADGVRLAGLQHAVERVRARAVGRDRAADRVTVVVVERDRPVRLRSAVVVLAVLVHVVVDGSGDRAPRLEAEVLAGGPARGERERVPGRPLGGACGARARDGLRVVAARGRDAEGVRADVGVRERVRPVARRRRRGDYRIARAVQRYRKAPDRRRARAVAVWIEVRRARDRALLHLAELRGRASARRERVADGVLAGPVAVRGPGRNGLRPGALSDDADLVLRARSQVREGVRPAGRRHGRPDGVPAAVVEVERPVGARDQALAAVLRPVVVRVVEDAHRLRGQVPVTEFEVVELVEPGRVAVPVGHEGRVEVAVARHGPAGLPRVRVVGPALLVRSVHADVDDLRAGRGEAEVAVRGVVGPLAAGRVRRCWAGSR